MTNRSFAGFISFALSLSLAVTAPARAQSSDVARLSWMSGCWQRRTPNNASVVDEQWMAPRAGTMLGMSRTVRGDTLVAEYEHLRISMRRGAVVYHAEPSGQAPADFTTLVVTDTLVTFENPQHDFPQRIIYRRRGADSLFARIEGTVGGRLRAVDFPFARAACP